MKFHEFQREILSLYDLGFNVFPLPFGRKSGYPWRHLQYTRLNRNHPVLGVSALFSDYTNAGIICGRTSLNLFVLDCETENSFQRNARELRKRDIPIWAVKTARGGHFYLRSSEGEVSSVTTSVLGDMEVRGKNAYVLAPPSLHPDGVFYEWLLREGDAPPIVHPLELDWLRDSTDESIQLEYDTQHTYKKSWTGYQHKPASNLSHTTQDYLRFGHSTPEGARNDSLFRAACDLAGNGYSREDAYRLLDAPASSSGLDNYEIVKTIGSAYSQPRTPSRPGKYQPTPETWHFAAYFAVRHPWEGRTRSTDRAVFLALVERARVAMNESGLFRGSIRELAELARMGTATVMRALKRFQEAETPLIKRVSNDRMSGACLWAFTEYVLETGKEHATTIEEGEIPEHFAMYATSLFNADACERGVVGKSAMYLYRYMTTHQQAMMPQALQQYTGLTINQVNYALQKLKQNGLVLREQNGWYALAMTDAELDKFVKAPPKAAQRKQRFKEEREMFVGNKLFRKKRAIETSKIEAFARQYERQSPDATPAAYEDFLRWSIKVLNPAFTAAHCDAILAYCLYRLRPQNFKPSQLAASVPVGYTKCLPVYKSYTTLESVYQKRLKRRDKPG